MAEFEIVENGDSDEVQVGGAEDGSSSKGSKAAKHDSGAADLERVTDYAEEKEIFSADQFQGVSNHVIFFRLFLCYILFTLCCVVFLQSFGLIVSLQL